MKRVAVERVGEGSEFPGAHVAGEEKDAFAARWAHSKFLAPSIVTICEIFAAVYFGNCENSPAIHPIWRTIPRMIPFALCLAHHREMRVED